MRSVALIALALCLGACESVPKEVALQMQQSVAEMEPEIEPLGILVIDDQRLPESKTTKVLSAWIGSCENAVERMGDDEVLPDRLARLEKAVTDAFGDSFKGKTLTVRQYDVHLNANARIAGSSIASGFSSVGLYGVGGDPSGIKEKIVIRPSCTQEKMKGGWFDPADLTNNISPIIIDLDITLDDRAYRVNSAYSPFVDLYSYTEDPIADAEAQKAAAKANQRLVEIMRAAQTSSAQEQ
jgi:hypothetical protein